MMKNIILIYFIILFGILFTSGCKKGNSTMITKRLKYITFKPVSKYGMYRDTSQFFYYEGNDISMIK